ncbi:hypothetical protein LTR85_009317 [Meristemomyces frigidus]|nr:hypothetical protein LTR85_009317 [Meristemomyces frigidus]
MAQQWLAATALSILLCWLCFQVWALAKGAGEKGAEALPNSLSRVSLDDAVEEDPSVKSQDAAPSTRNQRKRQKKKVKKAEKPATLCQPEAVISAHHLAITSPSAAETIVRTDGCESRHTLGDRSVPKVLSEEQQFAIAKELSMPCLQNSIDILSAGVHIMKEARATVAPLDASKHENAPTRTETVLSVPGTMDVAPLRTVIKHTAVPKGTTVTPSDACATTTNPAEVILPFERTGVFANLHLPRELRDEIYDLSTLSNTMNTASAGRTRYTVRLLTQRNNTTSTTNNQTHGHSIKTAGRPALSLTCRQSETEFLDTLRRHNSPFHAHLTVDFLHTAQKMRALCTTLTYLRTLKPRRLFLSFGLQRADAGFYDVSDAGAALASQ